jgi:predicted glycogen debranching enzyme
MKSIHFGRGICGELSISESMEWLVTNGIGGYASGTVANLLTRRYHGLLVAALQPPLGRTLLVSKLDDTVDYDGKTYPIYTNRWADVLVEPHGYRHIDRFHLDGTTPVWTFSFGGAQMEKSIWMQPGANTTYVYYRLVRATAPISLVSRVMVNYRDFYRETHAGDWQMQVRRVPQGLRVGAFEEAVPFQVLSDRASINQEHHWYRNFSLKMEPFGGSAVMEDHLNVGEFSVTLNPEETVTFVISTETSPNLDGASALRERQDYENNLVSMAPDLPARLVVAADQFIVKRKELVKKEAEPDLEDEGYSIIAGYHWLRDWGRDTLISLPGLLLATGRYDAARSILKSFSHYVSEGMLPSHLPLGEGVPEYIAADVTLWYFEAIRAYYKATADIELLKQLFPILVDIIDWHERGTRFHIKVDPLDGLLYAGEPGVPLTWMDAKAGDWGITPRTGKPVEINALWYNALLGMQGFAKVLNQPSERFKMMADKTYSSFSRFWNEKLGFCYDVIDTPAGDDPALRPTQLLAVSLLHSPLTRAQQKSIVDICFSKLLTPLGLRSLSPEEPGYIGHYSGDYDYNDSAYHQGTVWGWLIGPFVSAHLRVYQDPQAALSFLEPFIDHLSVRGIGSISEIFDGDAPFTPRGCIAQAWSVAELLRVWREIELKKAELSQKEKS